MQNPHPCAAAPHCTLLSPVQGAAKGDLVDTFSRVLGVFVHYTDEKVDATVKSWNVKILGLNRQSRHRDATVAQASPPRGKPALCPAGAGAARGSGPQAAPQQLKCAPIDCLPGCRSSGGCWMRTCRREAQRCCTEQHAAVAAAAAASSMHVAGSCTRKCTAAILAASCAIRHVNPSLKVLRDATRRSWGEMIHTWHWTRALEDRRVLAEGTRQGRAAWGRSKGKRGGKCRPLCVLLQEVGGGAQVRLQQ